MTKQVNASVRSLRGPVSGPAEQRVAIIQAQLSRIAAALATVSDITKRAHATSKKVIQNLRA